MKEGDLTDSVSLGLLESIEEVTFLLRSKELAKESMRVECVRGEWVSESEGSCL